MKKYFPIIFSLLIFVPLLIFIIFNKYLNPKDPFRNYSRLKELNDQYTLNCNKAGERASWNGSCCEGLTRVAADKDGFVITDGGGNCIKCGDSKCGVGESKHNCPEDCLE